MQSGGRPLHGIITLQKDYRVETQVGREGTA